LKGQAMFKIYSNTFSKATRSAATFIFIIGLLLIGFGVVIIAFPEIFAFLAAMIFFIAGIGCAGTALKIFLASRRMRSNDSAPSNEYRDNVRIHELDDFEETP
jgi:predicted membrane protein